MLRAFLESGGSVSRVNRVRWRDIGLLNFATVGEAVSLMLQLTELRFHQYDGVANGQIAIEFEEPELCNKLECSDPTRYIEDCIQLKDEKVPSRENLTLYEMRVYRE